MTNATLRCLDTLNRQNRNSATEREYQAHCPVISRMWQTFIVVNLFIRLVNP